MAEPATKRLKTTRPETETSILDKEGDVLLTVVSEDKTETKALSRSVSEPEDCLPYFSMLLCGYFKEATQLRRIGKVQITLEEDDPKAMKFILGMMHHNIGDVDYPPESGRHCGHCDTSG